ncbi:MAG: ImmA/IrrE family metallo-endopeptidase [Candidatus Humimicrobiaceae bacterium]
MLTNEPQIIIKDMPEEFRGIYLTDGKYSCVYVNAKLDTANRICTIVHELIHHKYYPNCNFYDCKTYFDICQCNWIENKINKKVAKILISDEILARKVFPYIASYSLSELAEEINITEELLKLRLNIFLDFITK